MMANRELQNKTGPHPSERSTRHIELALHDGVTYEPGDHLGVIPHNSAALVRRVAERFGSPKTARYASGQHRAQDVLAGRRAGLGIVPALGLRGAAGRRPTLGDTGARRAHGVPSGKGELLALGGDDAASVARYREDVLAKNVSLIDLLEEYRACELPFNVYLEMLPPLAPRYYSISSSPLVDSARLSITVGVVEGPARSGRGEYHGVCSTYLAEQADGSVIDGFVRPPSTPFVLPEDPSTPMIMVGPGTGLAPFRGFLQERAAVKRGGKRSDRPRCSSAAAIPSRTTSTRMSSRRSPRRESPISSARSRGSMGSRRRTCRTA